MLLLFKINQNNNSLGVFKESCRQRRIHRWGDVGVITHFKLKKVILVI